MLSLGRKPGEYIVLGDNIVVAVIKVDGDLRIAIDAPKDVKITRGEVWEKDHERPSIFDGKSLVREKKQK